MKHGRIGNSDGCRRSLIAANSAAYDVRETRADPAGALKAFLCGPKDNVLLELGVGYPPLVPLRLLALNRRRRQSLRQAGRPTPLGSAGHPAWPKHQCANIKRGSVGEGWSSASRAPTNVI